VQKMLGQNNFAELNWHVFTFLHPKLIVQCTDGVALLLGNRAHKGSIGGCLGGVCKQDLVCWSDLVGALYSCDI